VIAISDKLNIDAAGFEEAFDRTPFAVTHNLAGDPLLELDALAGLAERLPEASIEHNKGDLPKIADPGAIERSELPVGEIARTIDTNGCWMVLKNIEQDPAYGQLLDDLLSGVQPMVADRDGGMMFLQGFVFLSAPGSMTPSHCDPEHNFLLQIRGQKDMNVGEFPDEETERELLERAASGKVHRNLDWEPANSHCFALQPGEGVYVPPWAPHWVQNGPQASVSLSITFHTPVNKRKIGVNAFNAKLRRIGLKPAPLGQHPGRDAQKANVQKVLSRLGG
jgi:hypothetical protein